MNTKEFTRVLLDASPDVVRAWLESAAAAAEQIGGSSFGVVSLEIDMDEEGSRPAHRRRYGVFNGKGVQVLDADIRSPHASTTVLELRRDDAFPLMMEELIRRLAERFPGASGDVLAQKPRGRIGAPPLACNVWLEEKMRRLVDPDDYHHLYHDWLVRYVTLRGYEPEDPHRSFRAAATSCLKRIRNSS